MTTLALTLPFLTASNALAHAPWKHTAELEAPKLHYLTWLRGETNSTRSGKCLGTIYRSFVPAYRVPAHLRPYSIKVEREERLPAARAADNRCGPAVGSVAYWRDKQIAAAEVLGRESAGDPWPNCPDPYDGGGYSWYDTVQCENGGNWLDSPGYYRCGLQFDPMWERRFGRLCP